MQTKHFINDPISLVADSLQSLPIRNPAVALDAKHKVIYRRDLKEERLLSPAKVSIVAGGGSGHEPGFAGFVGKGFLSASVAGHIFASPAAEQVRHALLYHIPSERGILVLVMNYTGDVLNFGIAAEKIRAKGLEAEVVIVGDDVSVGKTKGGRVGRRGIAGSVLVAKIAGALAELGEDLTNVCRVAKLAARNLVSVGSSLDRAHVPGLPRLGSSDGHDDQLEISDEVEIGMGIHNEHGTCRVKAGLSELVQLMLAQLLDTTDSERNFVSIVPADNVVMLINNLGSVSELELGAITTEVWRQLARDYNLTPRRVLSGTFLSSLNGLGWSVTLLKVEDTGLGHGKSMLELIDFPTEAIGWSAPVATATWNQQAAHVPSSGVLKEAIAGTDNKSPPSNLMIGEEAAYVVIRHGLASAIASEPEVTRFDDILGDGDCGISLRRTAEAIQKLLSTSQPSRDTVDVADLIEKISVVVEREMGGTSGALYAIFLNALVAALREQGQGQPRQIEPNRWASVLHSSIQSLQKYTTAKVGDRTLMDSLLPFGETFASTLDVRRAARSSRAGAEATKSMRAKLGRAVYVGGEAEWINIIPDPGAWGLAAFFDGMSQFWS